MNIREMHIEIGLASQQVASSINRRFQPEEIDWILNKTIDRYVRDCIQTKATAGESDFEEFQIDADKISTLMEYDYPVRTVARIGAYTITLPANYLHLVEDNSMTIDLCKHPLTNVIKPKITYYCKLRMSPSVKTAAPFYTNLGLSINSVSMIEAGDVPAGMPSRDMLFSVVEILRDLMAQKLSPSVQVYWERAGDAFTPNAFIIISDSPITASLTYDGTTITGASTTTEVQQPDLIVAASRYPNRLTKSDRIGKLQQSSFAKSRNISPLSALDKGMLRVYSDDTFIVTQVLLSYVRKPRKVSLILNKNCDLPEVVHADICDRAVEYIQMTILDPGYQAKLQDNKIRGN